MFTADFHIHSRYSRATSRDCVPEMLELWARRKGLELIGTGDFTHPAWREELRDKLLPAEEGLYRLKEEHRLREGAPAGEDRPARFIVTGEISSIYKKDGRVRKVHNVIMLPDLDAAEALAKRLELIGNLHSDGRPILGLDSRDLLEITLDVCPRAIFVPAHIWTPHFSLFGAYSGFDRIEDCFGDMTPYIHALETGLSSDPPMNWRLSALDGYTLISNSDAHSPANLAREANRFDTELSYTAVAEALRTRKGFLGTVEFFPEEGKYHYDGHRHCKVCLKPSETIAAGGVCPVCGGRITVGVLHRVEELADRPEGTRHDASVRFESLIPLPEVVAASMGCRAASGKARAQYEALLERLGSELHILLEAPVEEIEQAAGPLVAEGIRRLRSGNVEVNPGYDGEYGRVRILSQDDIDRLTGQLRFFEDEPAKNEKKPAAAAAKKREGKREEPIRPAETGLNPEQREAVAAAQPAVAVIAGPGTGKTRTLVSRIAWLVEQGVPASHITAVTFTNKAAKEMRQRLEDHFGDKRTAGAMTIGTFHAVCLQLLRKWEGRAPILDRQEALSLAEEACAAANYTGSPLRLLEGVSRIKNGAAAPDTPEGVPAAAYDAYCRLQRRFGARDYDDLLLDVLHRMEEGGRSPVAFSHLLVDEFQDINDLQYRLIRAWSRGGESLFVIGDPDQAIYGFRGADARCFDRLAADFPVLRLIRLTQNYRSTPEILRCALPVIAADGKERRLEPQRESGKAVGLLQAEDPFAEALFITKEINRLVGGIDMLDAQETARKSKSGVRGFADIAVLYRTHRQADLLEYCFAKEGIPYTVAGRDDFLEAPQVRRVAAFFRFLLDPADVLSLRVCLLAADSHAGKRLEELTAAFAAGGNSLSALADMLDGLEERDLDGGFPLLAQALRKFPPLVRRGKPAELLEAWMRDNALEEDWELGRLRDVAVFHERMPEFLEALSLGREADIVRRSRVYTPDAVTLSTLHGAKGLEFPVVFLCGVQAGKIPLTGGRGTDPEEERRLFYVGLTRAREELLLSGSGEPSPFLTDIPPSCLEMVADRRQPFQGKQLHFF